MDIQHIKYFLEVVKHQSFSKAAEHLFVTQPILTRCIQNLEKEFGLPLIIRSTKSFVLTDAGQTLYTYGNQLLEDHEDLYHRIQDIKDSQVGEIHITSPGVLLDLYFPKLVTEFRKLHPGIRISIRERGSHMTEQDVLDGNADIGLVMLPARNPNALNIYPVIRDRVSVIAHRDHPLAQKSSIHIKDLEGIEIITYNQSTTLYNAFVYMCQEEGFTPDISCQSMMPNFLLDVISYGNCVGVLPTPMLEQASSDDLVAIPITPEFTWEIAMITKKGRYMPNAANSFLDFSKHLLKGAV